MSEVYLRDVIDIPDSVHAGSFKVELSGGFTETAARVHEYVVTDQIQRAFHDALKVVRAAVRDGQSHAAYLHGSFGSGKSHFLTVLHAILNNDPAARAKPKLQPVIAQHDDWLGGKRFFMVPFHLVGAADIDSAILGGYVDTVRRLHPEAPTPPVYRADAMLADARRQRDFLDDDAKFAEWLGTDTGTPTVHDPDDIAPIGGPAVSTWTTAEIDRAFSAQAGDPVRDALISALLSGPMASYVRGASGDARAFIPLEDGLSVISKHTRQLGYDGVVLFLDELILWLQAHMSEQTFVKNQVSKLVKVIESGVSDRPAPIISFVSRQRDLSKLVGADITGADVKNLEAQAEYLGERFDLVTLEDRNLPAIIKERVLKPRPGQAAALTKGFERIESSNNTVKDVLLDANGLTGADWADFRDVYPLSPALLNVLVALSGALQRERTGLKLLQEMLVRRRDDFTVGQLFPLGDLWDVLCDGTGAAFTDKLREQSESAIAFHTKVRAHLLAKYGTADDPRYHQDDRLIKTLLLASLAPNVPALARLTGTRLAALNHGEIRSRTIPAGAMVVTRLRELQAEFGELRADGDEDPVFHLVLSDLNVEPLLDAVGEVDRTGERRVWLKNKVWEALKVVDTDTFVCEREIVWRGTKRVAEFVFGNVRDPQAMVDTQFTPSVEGRIKFVLDYPFDDHDQHPSDDLARVRKLGREGHQAATIVWLPHFLSGQKAGQLGRLLKIEYLLERDRLDDFGSHLSADDRVRVRHQLEAQRDTLTTTLTGHLHQLYGLSHAGDDDFGAMVPDSEHVVSLQPGHKPRLQGGAAFEYSMLTLADSLFGVLYPKHPDFDPAMSRKALTTGDLRAVLGWITRAAENGNREVVDRKDLALVKRVVHPLDLGEVHDGPLNLGVEWRRRIDQQAAVEGVHGNYAVEDIREWIAKLGYTGLDKNVSNLLIAAYALLADRAWLLHGTPSAEPPALERIGSGWSLRAQAMPTAEQFSAAQTRAAVIFGVKVPDMLLSRNVNRLAAEVRGKINQLEQAVNGVRLSLDNHATALGLTPEADRVSESRDAADLLARLADHTDATALLIELAAVEYATSDQELASALTRAPGVLDAFDRADWTLLQTVRGFIGRGDGIDDRAQRLVAEVETAAAAHEFQRPFAVVLLGMRGTALAIIKDAFPPVDPPPPAPKPGGETPEEPRGGGGAGDGESPPKPARPRGSRRGPAKRFEAAFTAALTDHTAELRAYAANNPDAEIEVTVHWRPVTPGQP